MNASRPTYVTKIGRNSLRWFLKYGVHKYGLGTHRLTHSLTDGQIRMQYASCTVFTARAYARAVLGVVILSVCLSVRLSHAWIVTKLNDALQIFVYHAKGQSLCYSDTKSGWSVTPLPSEICVQSDPPPSKNADFDRFPLITSQP